jgi:pyruvate formate lyase activating enzyme
MKIGGLQPVTASDFPGRMAAIIFTQGCNFRCPFCHNSTLLSRDSDSLVPTDTVFSFLQRRQNLLGGVVISGGEPCLQEDLADFCAEIKKMGFALKVDTNGSRPEVLEDLLSRQLVDFIAMDVKAPLHRLQELTGTTPDTEKISRSISLIADSGVEHLFRTTDVTPLLSKKDHRKIKEIIPSGSRHIVQPFVASNALAPQLRQR